MQVMLLLSSVYVPIGHGELLFIPSAPHEDPGGQSMHVAEPSEGAYVPTWQASHASAEVALTLSALYLPLLHNLHLACPSTS